MDGIRGNAGGGVMAADALLPPGFVIENNGGPGLDAANAVLTLEDVKIKNNGEEGISFYQSLVMKGTANVISGNGGDGIVSWRENGLPSVSADGATIENNGGWGVKTKTGMTFSNTKIDGNKKGGIEMTGGFLTGQSFCVSDNGGDGIDATNATVALESGRICGNAGYGIKMTDSMLVSILVDICRNIAGGVRFAPDDSRDSERAGADDISRIENCRIAFNLGDGILFEGGAPLFLSDNIVEKNGGAGISNVSPSVAVQSGNDWWGDPSGPGGEGPGTGDEISGNVDPGDWRNKAIGLVLVLEKDAAEAAPGETVRNVVHVRNWIAPGDRAKLAFSDANGWTLSPVFATAALDPDFGAGVSFSAIVPNGAANSETNTVRIAATSENDPSVRADVEFDIAVSGASTPIPALSPAMAFSTAVLLAALAMTALRKRG
jgi:hypothetical protein